MGHLPVMVCAQSLRRVLPIKKEMQAATVADASTVMVPGTRPNRYL